MNLQDCQVVRTTTWSAGPGCHGGCGVLAHIKDGKLVKIEGDPDHPWNQGRLCARCLAMTQYVYHPDRLTHPLKRVGERGEGKWQEISWDEAFDLIEATHGQDPGRVRPGEHDLFHGHRARHRPLDLHAGLRLRQPQRHVRVERHRLLQPAHRRRGDGPGRLLHPGRGAVVPRPLRQPEVRGPKTIVIWGYNIPATCPDNVFGHWIIDLMKKGTEIICIDPRLSWFASRAKKWLPLRPGTDGALALGFLNVILNEGLYDPEFVAEVDQRPVPGSRRHRQAAARERPGCRPARRTISSSGTRPRQRPAIWSSADGGLSRGLRAAGAEGPATTVALADGTQSSCRTVWDAFRARVDEYPLERVAEITWLPRQTISSRRPACTRRASRPPSTGACPST